MDWQGVGWSNAFHPAAPDCPPGARSERKPAQPRRERRPTARRRCPVVGGWWAALASWLCQLFGSRQPGRSFQPSRAGPLCTTLRCAPPYARQTPRRSAQLDRSSAYPAGLTIFGVPAMSRTMTVAILSGASAGSLIVTPPSPRAAWSRWPLASSEASSG